MLEISLYDVCLCADFGGDGCAGTSTLGNDEVSETTLGTGAWWVAITDERVVNYDVDVG